MKSKEVAEKVIAKAMENGWQPNPHIPPLDFIRERHYFRHDFAKALWGDKRDEGLEEWKWQLKNMVLHPNPMEYLEHMDDDR